LENKGWVNTIYSRVFKDEGAKGWLGLIIVGGGVVEKEFQGQLEKRYSTLDMEIDNMKYMVKIL
jgi:hypothetical protein